MVALVALAGLACTSVKMVQREGCWVKQTETWLGGSSEELGFCSRKTPEWTQDRMARLLQECMAQADYRWENRAIAAWSHAQPIPPPETDESVAKVCMSQVSAVLGIEAENASLKARLAELSRERDALRGEAREERRSLHQSNDEMVSALGEAAKKSAPSAMAFSTSEGKLTSEPNQPPPATVVGMMAPPATTQVILPQAASAPQPASAPRPAASCVPRTPGAKVDAKAPVACKDPAPDLTIAKVPPAKTPAN